MSKWPKLDKTPMLPALGEEKYERALAPLQDRILHIQMHDIRTGGRAVVAVEGWDASGKSGLISRLIEHLEPRSVFVWRIGAPTQEEKSQHHLWRFWRRLPAHGNWSIFDRTWYGRVLVERVENFCSTEEWKRAYREINEFERQLADDGVRLVKLLMHTSEEEQKQRIVSRMENPKKHYKVGLEDFRNLRRRGDYLNAFDDMLAETDTRHAPWHVIASDDKRRARIEAFKVVAKILGRGVGTELPPLDPAVIEAARKLWDWKPGAGRKHKT
jgi:polyphosphate kinase 2 (PPK2 family)